MFIADGINEISRSGSTHPQPWNAIPTRWISKIRNTSHRPKSC